MSAAPSPDWRGGKHRACLGDSWDVDADRTCPCGCECHVDGTRLSELESNRSTGGES